MFPYPLFSTTQDLNLLSIHNRRLLLHSSLYYHHPPPPSSAVASPPSATETDATPSTHMTANGFDANVIMVLSVLLCALFCSLGLNSIVRCALGCSTYVNRNRNHENSDEENRRISSVALAKRGGIGKKALKMFPKISFSADLDLPGLDTECVICLSEFVPGERVRLLPKCNHGFHVKCIDRWLGLHTSCPTCRCCLVETCQKIVGRCNQASSSELSVPLPIVAQAQAPAQAGAHELVLNVAPLEREDMIHTSSNTTS